MLGSATTHVGIQMLSRGVCLPGYDGRARRLLPVRREAGDDMTLPADRTRDHRRVRDVAVVLRIFKRADLAIVEPWFRDTETRRYLGGPGWPAAMLERGERAVGEEFRGAVQTGAYRYLAEVDGREIGYVDCGTFDRCNVYGGEGPDGSIITESIELATGSIAFVIDPSLRRRGLGRAMVRALLRRPELQFVELFEAGVESENLASRRCLEAAGFRLRSPEPDCEGMLYYRAGRSGAIANAAPRP
jgi:RimJ/RimL family protein N-acetyltransferase